MRITRTVETQLSSMQYHMPSSALKLQDKFWPKPSGALFICLRCRILFSDSSYYSAIHALESLSQSAAYQLATCAWCSLWMHNMLACSCSSYQEMMELKEAKHVLIQLTLSCLDLHGRSVCELHIRTQTWVTVPIFYFKQNCVSKLQSRRQM